MSASGQQEPEFRTGGRGGRGYGRGSGNFNHRRNSFRNSGANIVDNRRRSDDFEGRTERNTTGNESEDATKEIPDKVESSSRPPRVSSAKILESTKSSESTEFPLRTDASDENHLRQNSEGQHYRGGYPGRRGSYVSRGSRGDQRANRRPRAAAGGSQRYENGRRTYERQRTSPARSNDAVGNVSCDSRQNDGNTQIRARLGQENRTASNEGVFQEITPANAREEKEMLRLALKQSQRIEDERRALVDVSSGLLHLDLNDGGATNKLDQEDFPPLSSSSASQGKTRSENSVPSTVLPEEVIPSVNDIPQFELDVGMKKTPDEDEDSSELPTQDWSRQGAKPKNTGTTHRRRPGIGRGSELASSYALGAFLKASIPAGSQQLRQEEQTREDHFSDHVQFPVPDEKTLTHPESAEPTAVTSSPVPQCATTDEEVVQYEPTSPNCQEPDVESRDSKIVPIVSLANPNSATPIYVSQLEARMATEDLERIRGGRLFRPAIDHEADLINHSDQTVHLFDGPTSSPVYESKPLTLQDHVQPIVYDYTDVRIMEQQRHLDEHSSLHFQQQQQQQQHLLAGVSQILVGFCPIPGGGGYPISVPYPMLRPSFQPVMAVTPDGQFIQTAQHGGVPFDFSHLMNRIQEYPGVHQQSDHQEQQQQQQHSPVESFQNLSGEGNAILSTPTPPPLFVHSQLSADALPFSPRRSTGQRGYQSYYNSGRSKPRRGGSAPRFNNNINTSRNYSSNHRGYSYRSNEENSRTGMSQPAPQQQQRSPRSQYGQPAAFQVVSAAAVHHARNYQSQEQYEMVPPPQLRHQQFDMDSQQQQQQVNHLYSDFSFSSFPQHYPNRRRYRHPNQE